MAEDDRRAALSEIVAALDKSARARVGRRYRNDAVTHPQYVAA